MAVTGCTVLTIFVLLLAAGFGAAAAEDRPAPAPAVSPQDFHGAIDRAVRFLETKGQAEDGSYSGAAGPGVTSVVVAAILRTGRSADDPLVAKSLKYLEGMVKPDGGVYASGSFYRNYETCLALLSFVEANRDGRYDKLIRNADRFVKGEQWDEGEDCGRDNPAYGGAGYGKHKRPDLSNTSFLIDALRAAGNGPDDEAVQRALVFVSRCQNLESEHNTTSFSAKNPDGGFYYTPAAGGTSMAGQTPEGGVGPDDPRVKAAFQWAQKHYDVQSNPGMGNAGLYYYYHTFAKALAAMNVDRIEDSDGVKHDWRRELAAELLRRQQPDGSWVNENSRWMEGDPSLVTGYALLTLSYCRPAIEESAR
jgi:squalene-hopene/tetraprenyl-beta-curcumene cyclase